MELDTLSTHSPGPNSYNGEIPGASPKTSAEAKFMDIASDTYDG